MKTLTAKHNGEITYIHYVSKFLEYTLVSYEVDGTKRFKINVRELTDVTEEDLLKMLREQELNEQGRR